MVLMVIGLLSMDSVIADNSTSHHTVKIVVPEVSLINVGNSNTMMIPLEINGGQIQPSQAQTDFSYTVNVKAYSHTQRCILAHTNTPLTGARLNIKIADYSRGLEGNEVTLSTHDQVLLTGLTNISSTSGIIDYHVIPHFGEPIPIGLTNVNVIFTISDEV